MYTPDRELNPPAYDGWEEKEKADNLVKEAAYNYNRLKDNPDMFTGFFGGAIEWKKRLDFAESVLVRCEKIREKVYNEYK